MIRSLLTLALVAALAGCASKPAPVALQGAPKVASMDATATLATNACEAATAPLYTRAIVAVRQATRAFQAGQLDAARLQADVDAGRDARDALGKACEGRRDAPEPAQLRRAQAAIAKLTTGGR